MSEIAINYEPFAEQRLIHDALRPWNGRHVVMAICGRRFGKTTLAINEIVARAIEIPNARIWYLAPTKEQAYMIAWRLFFNYCPPELIKRSVENRHFIELVNGSLIEFKGTQDEVFLLGVALHFVVLDEFPTMPYSLWYDVIKPMLADHAGDALFIATIPDPRVHSITVEFLDMYEEGLRNIKRTAEAKPGRVVSFNFPSMVNPNEKVRQETLRDIAELKRKGQERDAQRLYYGKYSKGTGRIWPQFNYDRHTIESIEIPSDWTCVMAVDPHPQKPICALWAAADRNNEVYIFREKAFTDITGRSLTIIETAAEIRVLEKERVRFRVIDPTFAKVDQNAVGAKSTKDIYTDYGLCFIEASRTVSTFYDKLTDRLVEEPHPTIHFLRTCPNVIRQVQNAVWDSWSSARDRELRGAKDQIKKGDDDFRDCLKYILNFGIRYIDQAPLDAVKGKLADRWRQGDFM